MPDWRPHEESNLDLRFRKPLFYPLNYGDLKVVGDVIVKKAESANKNNFWCVGMVYAHWGIRQPRIKELFKPLIAITNTIRKELMREKHNFHGLPLGLLKTLVQKFNYEPTLGRNCKTKLYQQNFESKPAGRISSEYRTQCCLSWKPLLIFAF